MSRTRVSASMRRVIVVMVLVATSGAASSWRAAPERPRTLATLADLLPRVFTTSSAAGPPITTGCTGTPVENDANLGGASGALTIQINSITLVGTNTDSNQAVSKVMPNLPKDLNFAKPSGSIVGDFVSNFNIGAGNFSFTSLDFVMDNNFRIMCAVTCDTDGAGPLGSRTFVTKGGSSQTQPDGLGTVHQGQPQSGGSAAIQSTLPISTSPQSFSMPLRPPLVVQNGQSSSKSLGFAPAGACELWDVSPVNNNQNGTNFKILPKSISASVQ